MYSASQEGHGKSADNECCNTLILFIAILRNIVRISRDRQDGLGLPVTKLFPLLRTCHHIHVSECSFSLLWRREEEKERKI